MNAMSTTEHNISNTKTWERVENGVSEKIEVPVEMAKVAKEYLDKVLLIKAIYAAKIFQTLKNRLTFANVQEI